MKLYNYRNLLKIASIIFILLSSIYVLYIFNYEYKTLESLANANMLDCSKCEMRPASGNCVPIYDISYTYTKIGTSNKYKLDICNIITNNVFCEWEPRCQFENSGPAQRLAGITCCSGSPFYDNNTINFNYGSIQDNITNITDCSNIKGLIRSSLAGTVDLSYDDMVFYKTNEICNTLEESASLLNTRGMLFSKAETTYNIFNDPMSMPRDIITFISFSNIRNEIRAIISGAPRTPQILPNALNGFNDASLNNIEIELRQMDANLRLKAINENIQRQLVRSDLTSNQINRFTAIITTLESVYSVVLPNTILQERKNISYNPVKNSKSGQNYDSYMAGSQYLLNSNQFYNCMGDITNDNSGSFSSGNLLDLSNNDYFGTAGRPISLGGLGEASYNALGSMTYNMYPNNTDLEMELKRLETIPSTGNAPVSIINTYLNAINSFYEKQLNNLTGPREHTFNQELVFDNNTLGTKEPTFFTYNKDQNNVYTCQQSITGDSNFEYCGPEAYYDSPHF